MTNASRSHDEAVIELLREDPSFADEYLAAAMEQANQDGGREALLAALIAYSHIGIAGGKHDITLQRWRLGHHHSRDT